MEKKWQKLWQEKNIYKTAKYSKGKKKYILDMFPYPSGASMHVGHLEGYVGTDILSRYFRMNGFSVMHPMGWDAFGLPAENYAIKTGVHPDKSTHDNIKNFKRQLENSGMSYDWDNEIDTSSPEFYKWTQWIFLRMFKAGLAYKKKAPVNWCPKDETVLANEQVIDGKCERCDTPVIQKELDQWFLKITDYADRLISGLDRIDWLPEVKRQQINWIGKSERGKKAVTYHLRDWLISRQRYWGCPIPMIYCQDHDWQPVDEKNLPVLLPIDVDFLPHGESPIARSKSFQKDVVCPICKKPAKREVDTMDTYIDSSWYFIRFIDPNNKKEFVSKENAKKWLPVDDYVGGGHVVQHLLFARFFWKFLYDQGLIDRSLGDEPFLKLRAPGWILGADSRKMSKRWGNVVTPDDIIPKFGADTLRVYEMFMGPFDVMKPWSMTGVEGAARFLGRVRRLFVKDTSEVSLGSSEVDIVRSKLHQTIKKVTEDIEAYKFNTAISALMEFVNTLYDAKVGSSLLRGPRKGAASREAADIWYQALKTLCLLLAPFAPHLSEELWVGVLGEPFSVHKASWPRYDAKYIVSDTVTVVVQVNGRVRSQLTIDHQTSAIKDKVLRLAKGDAKVSKWLKDGRVKREIFVPGKLVNFVTE